MAAKATTLTNREITKLLKGLKNLVGIASKDGSMERFDFDDNTSWNLAKNLAIVERASETFEREKKRIASVLNVVDGMKLSDANAEAVAKFLHSVEELNEKTNSLDGLLRFKRKDLQKAGKIPHSTLSDVMPLIDE